MPSKSPFVIADEIAQSCNIRQGDGETISACAGCIGSRRNILLTKVVLPLRDALYALKWETVLEKPDVIPAKPAETQRAGLRSQLARSRKANDDTSEAVSLSMISLPLRC